MAQILLPTREAAKQEKQQETALDKLVEGLQVAGSVFGIASDISALSTQSQARDIAAAREGREAAKFGLETQRTTLQAPEGAPGTALTLQTPEGEEVTQLRVPKPKGQDDLMAGKLKLQQGQQKLQDLNIKLKEKELARDASKSDKAFTMTEEQRQGWRNRGVSDNIIQMVEAGHGGRNPTNTLIMAAERDEPKPAEVSIINGFDESNRMLAEVVADAKPEFIGPIDGRLPKNLISPQQAQFRSKMGRMNAAYRRAITGLTASDQERAELMELLPTETDNFNNFIAKARALDKELNQKRTMYIQNLERGGRFVGPFKEMGSTLNIAGTQGPQAQPAQPLPPAARGMVQTSAGAVELNDANRQAALEILRQRQMGAPSSVGQN